MRGYPTDSPPVDNWKLTKRMIKRYLKRHELTNTPQNRKRARDALRKAHYARTNPPGKSVAINESAADWQIVYGKQRVGGVITYASTADDTSTSPIGRDAYLLVCITISCHTINKITKVLLDDTEVTLDAALDSNGDVANGTGKWANKLKVQVNLGDHTTALSELITDSGGDWTSSCIQRGCAHVYLRLRYNEDVYPGGMPQIQFEVEGFKMRDHYSSLGVAAGYSRNAALILNDFLLDSVFGADKSITWTGIFGNDTEADGGTGIEAITICDQNVSLDGGGTEPRYQCDITISGSESVGGAVDKILSTFGGQIVDYAALAWGGCQILAPAYRTPVFTLEEKDIISSEISVSPVVPVSEYYGRIGGTHINPDKNWEECDFPTVDFSGGVGDPYWDREDISLPGTLSVSMCQRLAKIQLLRDKYALAFTAIVRLNFYKYGPGDNFYFPYEPFGWRSPLLEGLVSYWKMDEASGDALDAHGSNYAVNVGAVGSSTGKVGGARDFAGGNYFGRSDNADLSTGDIDFTFSGWFKLDTQGTAPDGARVILSKSNNTSGSFANQEYTIMVYNDGNIYFTVSSGAANVDVVGGAISTGVWYFFVAWHDSVANTVNIQINNGTVNSVSWANGGSDTAFPLEFGRGIGVGVGGGRYMDGLIDEVGFWKRVLTSQERTDLYNTGNGLSYDEFAVGKVFELQETELVWIEEEGERGLGVRIIAKENVPEISDWTSSEEQSVTPMPTARVPTPEITIYTEPSNLAATSSADTHVDQPDGGRLAVVELTWTAPTDSFVLEGGNIEMQHKRSSVATWRNDPTLPGAQTEQSLSGFAVGRSYDFRIRSKRTDGTYSAWVQITHVVRGDTRAGEAMGVLGLTYS